MRYLQRWKVDRLSALCLSALIVSVVGLAMMNAPADAASAYNLIDGGTTVRVGTTASMPNTNVVRGKFVGFEAEMLTTALKNLGLNEKVSISDFPGMLAAAQDRRIDVAAGNIAWRPSRVKNGIMTDPIFYVPQIAAEKPGVKIASVDDLKGKTVGTISGFIFVQALQHMPDVKLRTYPDAATTLTDLNAGRIDVALIDPLVAMYTKKTNPNLKFDVSVIRAPTLKEVAEHPYLEIFGPVMIGWYLPNGEEKLRDGLNQQIRQMYKNGETAKLMVDAGIEDANAFLTVPEDWAGLFTKQRIETDRTAGWTLPMSGSVQ